MIVPLAYQRHLLIRIVLRMHLSLYIFHFSDVVWLVPERSLRHLLELVMGLAVDSIVLRLSCLILIDNDFGHSLLGVFLLYLLNKSIYFEPLY